MNLKNNRYCIECGHELFLKVDNEGTMVPYCDVCGSYQYDPYYAACSMLVLNPQQDKILLVKQYGLDFYRLVAGYINKGENPQTCIVRELAEELQAKVSWMKYNDSLYFEPSNTLMLNYIVVLESLTLTCNFEIDEMHWVSFDQALTLLRPTSLAKKFLEHYLMEVEYGK